MVNEADKLPRCADCSCALGNIWQGYIYCSWLKCDVWAKSIQCKHGADINDLF